MQKERLRKKKKKQWDGEQTIGNKQWDEEQTIGNKQWDGEDGREGPWDEQEKPQLTSEKFYYSFENKYSLNDIKKSLSFLYCDWKQIFICKSTILAIPQCVL